MLKIFLVSVPMLDICDPMLQDITLEAGQSYQLHSPGYPTVDYGNDLECKKVVICSQHSLLVSYLIRFNFTMLWTRITTEKI